MRVAVHGRNARKKSRLIMASLERGLPRPQRLRQREAAWNETIALSLGKPLRPGWARAEPK
jgi:hypothetical protein